MANLLGRVWTATVGAVAGACLGLVASLLMLTMKIALDFSLWAVAAGAIVGAIAGFALGNRKLGGK
jgi:hypothetical protein